ncbi:hypothetical protein P409_23205 [Inquilinus limosus MP06]|uniref:Uncharacterized protein n=1 Tax=Inquilinus limosus MP06 TaxID=1398085 RepID=A0A0A0D244_9PROT|nr:hypothetical protein P409_23205 [Inquilinus limosus MP06]
MPSPPTATPPSPVGYRLIRSSPPRPKTWLPDQAVISSFPLPPSMRSDAPLPLMLKISILLNCMPFDAWVIPPGSVFVIMTTPPPSLDPRVTKRVSWPAPPSIRSASDAPRLTSVA